MREEILAAIVRGDEAEAFGIVEPLDCTCCHISYPKKIEGRLPDGSFATQNEMAVAYRHLLLESERMPH
jgi:hypothetical protein